MKSLVLNIVIGILYCFALFIYSCSANNATTDAQVVDAIQMPAAPAAPAAPLACNQTAPVTVASPLNKTAILVTAGVVCSLGLVFLIVNALRRFYKPIRPKIKKTFVVRNKMDRNNRTPLTCRPAAPEQCEITIENCCNMNICDTVRNSNGVTVVLH